MTRLLTKGKTFQALQRSLRAANAKFKKLTRAEQRVMIAQDVIAQIKAEQIIPSSTYFDASYHEELVEKACNADIDLSEFVAQVPCEVCGIGSLFVAAVRKADNLKASDFLEMGGREEEVDYLEKWFDADQLDLVENYYERNGNGWGLGPIYYEDDDSKRMEMIMENIASNRGKFDPHKGAHRITK